MFAWAGFAVSRRVARGYALTAAVLLLGCTGLHAAPDQRKPGEPTDPKAYKTFLGAADWEKHGDLASAVNDYRKANKQDGGHCSACLSRAYSLAMKISAYKDAVGIARDFLAIAQTNVDQAGGHLRLGVALQREGALAQKRHAKAELETLPQLDRSRRRLFRLQGQLCRSNVGFEAR